MTTVESVQRDEEVFDLEDPLIISDNIEKADYLSAKPTTATASSLNGNTDIRFEVNSTVNPLTIYDSFLKITVRLYKEKSDGTGTAALAATDVLAHNWVMNLFKSAKLELGGKVVEEISDIGNASQLLGHCLKTYNYSKTYGEREGWIPDTGDSTADATKNSGFKRRMIYAPSGFNQAIEVIIPLSNIFGFCDYRRLLYLIPISLELKRNDNDKLLYFISGAEPDTTVATTLYPKSQITKIEWYIPTLKLSNEMKTKVTNIINKNKGLPIAFLKRYSYTRKFITDDEWIIKTTGNQPRYHLIGFKEIATTNKPAYTTNNSKFDNAGLKEIQVDLNGELYPAKAITTDFPNKRVMEAYQAYCNFCIKNFKEPSLSLYDFMNIYTIYVIDTSAQPVTLKTNTIMIKVNVKKDNATEYQGFCLCLEDEKGVIDCSGGSMISYTKGK